MIIDLHQSIIEVSSISQQNFSTKYQTRKIGKNMLSNVELESKAFKSELA